MVSDGIRASQITAKHSLNGSWMADAFPVGAVLAGLKQALARLISRPGRRKHGAGRHAGPPLPGNRAPRRRRAASRHSPA